MKAGIMKNKLTNKNERRILTLTATVLALLVAASPAQGRNPNPGIIPPGSTYRGQSYGEWAAQWWKTIFSIPVVDGYHPLISLQRDFTPFYCRNLLRLL